MAAPRKIICIDGDLVWFPSPDPDKGAPQGSLVWFDGCADEGVPIALDGESVLNLLCALYPALNKEAASHFWEEARAADSDPVLGGRRRAVDAPEVPDPPDAPEKVASADESAAGAFRALAASRARKETRK